MLMSEVHMYAIQARDLSVVLESPMPRAVGSGPLEACRTSVSLDQVRSFVCIIVRTEMSLPACTEHAILISKL